LFLEDLFPQKLKYWYRLKSKKDGVPIVTKQTCFALFFAFYEYVVEVEVLIQIQSSVFKLLNICITATILAKLVVYIL
jgi:hypothetical protein